MKMKKILAGLGVVAALGLAVLPLSASAISEDQIVTVNVNSTLFLQVAGTTATTMPTATTETDTLFNDVWAATSNSGGYTLTIAAKTAADVNLVSAYGDMISGSATVMSPAVSGSGAPGSFTGGSYTWSINTNPFTTNGGNTGQPAWSAGTLTAPTITAQTLGTTATNNTTASLVNAEGYRVGYGVTTANNQPNGQYQATNVFTVIDN